MNILQYTVRSWIASQPKYIATTKWTSTRLDNRLISLFSNTTQ